MENRKVETDLLQNLIEFIRHEIGEFKMNIEINTLIENDIGVTGDDADELIVNFSNKYHVDISNFIFKDYFYDEPHMFNIIPNRHIKPLKVGHLLNAIIAGRLDEGVISLNLAQP